MHFWEQADSVSTLFCFLIVCRTGIVPFFAHSVGKRSSSENVTSQELTFQCRCCYVAGCRCTIFWCRPPVLCRSVMDLHQVAFPLVCLLLVLNKSNVTHLRCTVQLCRSLPACNLCIKINIFRFPSTRTSRPEYLA